MSPREEEPARPAVEYADADAVREWAETLPARFLECREMTHNWRFFNVTTHKLGGYERTLRCTRCRTKKIQHVDASSGMLLGGTRYEHPDGYLHQGMGRIVGDGRGVVRLLSMQRQMTEGGE